MTRVDVILVSIYAVTFCALAVRWRFRQGMGEVPGCD